MAEQLYPKPKMSEVDDQRERDFMDTLYSGGFIFGGAVFEPKEDTGVQKKNRVKILVTNLWGEVKRKLGV